MLKRKWKMIQNYKQLERAAKLYLRLKELDAEIIELDALAITVSEHKASIVTEPEYY